MARPGIQVEVDSGAAWAVNPHREKRVGDKPTLPVRTSSVMIIVLNSGRDGAMKQEAGCTRQRQLRLVSIGSLVSGWIEGHVESAPNLLNRE